MTTPALPPPDASALAAWIEAYSSAVAAIVAVLVFLGTILGATWKFMVSPLRAKINSAHTRINETNKRIDLQDFKIAASDKERMDQHIANLGHFADLRRDIAEVLQMRDTIDEIRNVQRDIRQEMREDRDNQTKRIDVLLRRSEQ